MMEDGTYKKLLDAYQHLVADSSLDSPNTKQVIQNVFSYGRRV